MSFLRENNAAGKEVSHQDSALGSSLVSMWADQPTEVPRNHLDREAGALPPEGVDQVLKSASMGGGVATPECTAEGSRRTGAAKLASSPEGTRDLPPHRNPRERPRGWGGGRRCQV